MLRLLPAVEAELAIHEDRIVALDLTAVAAAPSIPVELRTGVHDGFVRIVLDWRRPIGFATAGAGRRWRILFDREGEIDAAAIARRFPEFLEEVSAHRGAGRSELALALRPGVRADVFEVAGERVVVDLQPPGAASPSALARPTSEVTPPATAETAPAVALGAREVAPPMSVLPALAVAPAAGEPRSPTPAETAPAPAPAAGEASLATPLTLHIGTAEVARGVALDFAWSEPVAAAFLLRAGHLWSVFAPAADRAGLPVLPSLASPIPGHLGSGELVEASGGIAIWFPLRRPLAATAERAGARWRVVLDAGARPPVPARLERRPDPSRLRLVADETVRLVSVIDPEVGDRLELWPLLAPGRGQPRAQRLVDLELLATAQSLAWRTLSDRVQARILGDAVELSAPEGLSLSLPTALAAAPRTALASRPRRMRSVGARSRATCRRHCASGAGCCARALAAADQPDAALALLDVRAGPSAQRLRAEILWQQRDWPRLAAVIEALLADHHPAALLSAADQELVIRLAIAHARQGQEGALSILQARFGRAMRGEGAEPAFLLATATPLMTRSERAGRPQAVLAEAAAHLAGARAYLAGELTSP